MQAELTRRASLTDAVLAYFLARPLQWLTAEELEAVGGRQAWRSRVADARRIVKRDGGSIVNRQERDYAASAIL